MAFGNILPFLVKVNIPDSSHKLALAASNGFPSDMSAVQRTRIFKETDTGPLR